MGRKFSTEQSNEPATRLPPGRYVLGLLSPKKGGCTMTMLLARRVTLETIDELLAAGLATKKSEFVARQCQGQAAEQRRHRGHHDRAEPQQAGFMNCFDRALAFAALRLQREVDHHDRVLLDDSDQENDADDRDHGEIVADGASMISAPTPAEGSAERMVIG